LERYLVTCLDRPKFGDVKTLSSGSSPTWYPAVPALSTSMSDNPLSFATCRITASPNGDLQMLPRHTMSTEGITVTVLDMI